MPGNLIAARHGRLGGGRLVLDHVPGRIEGEAVDRVGPEGDRESVVLPPEAKLPVPDPIRIGEEDRGPVAGRIAGRVRPALLRGKHRAG
jgi:hypothetical protein